MFWSQTEPSEWPERPGGIPSQESKKRRLCARHLLQDKARFRAQSVSAIMKAAPYKKGIDQIIASRGDLAKSQEDRVLLAQMIAAPDAKHALIRKATREPGVKEIMTQMFR